MAARTDFLRVLIAAAWADGEITYQEMNCLKRFFLRFELSDDEMTELEPYLADPIGEAEARQTVEDFLRQARGRERDRLHAALRELLEVDGRVGEREEEFLRLFSRLEDDSNAATSFLGGLKRLWGGGDDDAPRPMRRADLLDDFVNNRVLYQVKRRLLESAGGIDLDADTERELRWVCASAALLGHVAAADHAVDASERARMAEILDRFGGLQRSDVDLVVDIVDSAVLRDVGYFTFTRELCAVTTIDERERFLDLLFEVASADGHIDYRELEEIRKVSKALELSHGSFIAAKARATGES